MERGFALLGVISIISLFSLISLGLEERLLIDFRTLNMVERNNIAFYRAKERLKKVVQQLTKRGFAFEEEVVIIKEEKINLCGIDYYTLITPLQKNSCLISRLAIPTKIQRGHCTEAGQWDWNKKTLAIGGCNEAPL